MLAASTIFRPRVIVQPQSLELGPGKPDHSMDPPGSSPLDAHQWQPGYRESGYASGSLHLSSSHANSHLADPLQPNPSTDPRGLNGGRVGIGKRPNDDKSDQGWNQERMWLFPAESAPETGFVFRELRRVMGEDQFWLLMLHPESVQKAQLAGEGSDSGCTLRPLAERFLACCD